MSSTLSPTSLATGTWSVDPVHSSIGFAVKHFGVSTFRGTFPGVSGTIVTDGGAVSRLEGAVEVASITTPDDNLTGHLASPDFFDAATYPQARFTSTRVDDLGEGRLRVAGELTIRGVTQPVELEAELEGSGSRPVRQRAARTCRLRHDRPHRVRHQLECPARERRARRRREGQADAPRRGRPAGGVTMAATTILAVPGSLRRDSVNRALLRLAAEHAPDGVELVLWDGLADFPAFNEDDEPAPADAVARLRSAIDAAGALLIATPEYNGSVPGALKNALDWASRPHGASALVAKPTAVLSASPSPFGAIWAQEELQKILRMSGALVLGRGLAVGNAKEKLADEGGRTTLGAQLGEILAELAVLEPEVEAAA